MSSTKKHTVSDDTLECLTHGYEVLRQLVETGLEIKECDDIMTLLEDGTKGYYSIANCLRYKISFVNLLILNSIVCILYRNLDGIKKYLFTLQPIIFPFGKSGDQEICKKFLHHIAKFDIILWGYYFPKENASQLIPSLTNLSGILTVPMSLTQHTEWKSCIHLSDTRWITLKWNFHQEGYFASTYEAQLMDSNGNIQSWCGIEIETICMFLHHSYKNTRMHLWINSVFGDIQPSLAFVLDLRNQLGLK